MVKDKIRLARDKSGGGMPMLERWCASEVLWSDVSMEVEGGCQSSSKSRRVVDALEAIEVPDNGHIEIGASPQKNGARIKSPTEVHLQPMHMV